MNQIAHQLTAKMPATTARARITVKAVEINRDGIASRTRKAELLANWIKAHPDFGEMLAVLTLFYFDMVIEPDMAGSWDKFAEPPPGSVCRNGHGSRPGGEAAGGASGEALVTSQTRFASPATHLHDGKASPRSPFGHEKNAAVVVKPNPPRFSAQSAALVQSDNDRAYFRTFMIRDTPIGEIRLGAAKTIAAQNEREARVLRACIAYAGGSDESMRLDELIPPRVLAAAIRDNGASHV